MKSSSKFRNLICNSTSRGCLAPALGVALLLLLLPASIHAQAVSRINGTVTDQAGAAIPDAKVTVTNVDTNVSKTTDTTSAGTYLVTDLIPGTYTVIAIADGWDLDWSQPAVILSYAAHGQTIVVPAGSDRPVKLPEPVQVQPK